MAYKVIQWLIIPFFAILLMSHNVSAMDFNYEAYDIYKFVGRGDTTCISDKPETVTGNSYCSFDLNSNNEIVVKSIYFTNATTNLKAGDIVEMNLVVRNNANYSISGGAFGLVEARAFTNYMTVMKVETVENNTYQQLFGVDTNLPGENVGFLSDVWIKPQLFRSYRITFRVDRDGDYNIGLTTAASGTRYIFRYYDTVNDSIQFIINNAIVYRPLQNKQDEAAEKELESTENIENQTPSDTPGGDNQSATNLIGNISGIFNQIANIPVGSSCSIDADFGNLDLGNLNLCTGKDKMPFIVNFGATVFQLVFVVSTGLILVRQVLSLYDWSRK